MLDFSRRSARPPNYLGRGAQYRLLGLVMLLGLVYFLMREVSNEKNWALFYLLTGSPMPAADGASGTATSREPIDTVVYPESPADQEPDAFRSPAARKAATGRRYYPGVREEYLQDVRDDMVFRNVEHDAFFHLLKILNDEKPEKLAAASKGPIAFAQLHEQSEAYRGELVTISGSARRVERIVAPRNEYGIKSYYRLVLQPSDAPTLPILVYVLELPEEFPRGGDARPHVKITGFFFKRLLYKADQIRTAPLVLAGSVDWNRDASLQQRPYGVTGVGIAVFAVLGLLGVLFLVFKRRRPAAIEQLVHPESDGPPDLSGLEHLETARPEEGLRTLAKESLHFETPNRWPAINSLGPNISDTGSKGSWEDER